MLSKASLKSFTPKPDISLSSWIARHTLTSFILTHYVRSISPKHGSMLNTCSNDFICIFVKIALGVAGRDDGSVHIAMILYVSILNAWRHISAKIASGVAVRGDCGIAGEGRLDGVPKFHSLGECTMPLMNINSDWMSNAFFGLWIISNILHYTGSFKLHLGV